MTMAIFHAVNMPMGFVVLFAFSTSFSSSENHVMHPVMVLPPFRAHLRHCDLRKSSNSPRSSGERAPELAMDTERTPEGDSGGMNPVPTHRAICTFPTGAAVTDLSPTA